MSTKRRYEESRKIANRRKVVIELWMLGFARETIVSAVSASRSTVNIDIASSKHCRVRARKSQKYAAKLRRYAELAIADRAETDELVFAVLSSVFSWERYEDMLIGAWRAIELMRQYTFADASWEKYLPLLRYLFNAPPFFFQPTTLIWKGFMKRVLRLGIPDDYTEDVFKRDLVQFFVSSVGGGAKVDIMPHWDASPEPIIQEIMTGFSERDSRIVLAHFVDGISMQEIGDTVGLSKQGVSIIIQKCGKEMRKSRHLPYLAAFFYGVDVSARSQVALKDLEILKVFDTYVHKGAVVFDHNVNEALFWRIEGLGFGTRVNHALLNCGVEYVCQLITMSDSQLLGRRNFGKKSLASVDGKLKELGLIRDGRLSKASLGAVRIFLEDKNIN